MMNLIDKVKTIIEYAKFGMFHARRQNGETLIDEVFFPRAITKYQYNWSGGHNSYCKKITGYLKDFGGNAFLSPDKTVVEIDLPYCINVYVPSTQGLTNSQINSTVKIIKLPSLRNIAIVLTFSKLKALEYLELGAVTNFPNNTVQGCDSLTEFYVKEGTTASLYLQYCPLITKECLHKVIENYADMTGATAPTFYMGAENLAKVDDEHIKMLEAKNINYQ